MATGVYIDGFNFYFGMFKNAARIPPKHGRIHPKFKWLDLHAFSQRLLPKERIDYVGYFTAPVNPQRSIGQFNRQRAYFLALGSIPEIEIVLGSFRWVNHKGTLNQGGGGQFQTFWHWEEKGSDVNLAMRMVRDACLGRFDKMLLISNDSDLVGTVDMVVNEFNIPVIQASPSITINKAFNGVATHSFIIQPDRMRKCILPQSITLADGNVVTCPPEWS